MAIRRMIAPVWKDGPCSHALSRKNNDFIIECI